MEYYLGVDIGTTSVKVVAFSTTGKALFVQSGFYKMYHPQPDQSEQNPEEVFTAVTDACNKIYGLMEKVAPKFVAFCSAMHSVMAIDESGKPLTNCIIWADNRASAIAEGLHASHKAKQYYMATGVPVHAMTPLCKLLWLKKNEPEIYSKSQKFIGIKEYIFHKLTGQYLIDTSVASATGFLNLAALQWDEGILHELDLNDSSFSELVPTKQIVALKKSTQIASQFWLPDGINLVIGGSDGALANLGAGGADGETLVVTIGTSSAARIITNNIKLDSSMRTFCYHITDEMYVVGGPGNNGAIVLEWFKTLILETSESYDELFAKAATIEPGCDGLLMLPYLLGERAPLWNSNAKGVFFGLSINHTQSHMIRACMEGVVFGLYSIAKIILEKRKVKGIYATGGFSQSHLWLQMLADMCNMEVSVSGSGESSALGAVMLGIEALHLQPLPVLPFVADCTPNVANHIIYKSNFEKFEKIIVALEVMWKGSPVANELLLV